MNADGRPTAADALAAAVTERRRDAGFIRRVRASIARNARALDRLGERRTDPEDEQ